MAKVGRKKWIPDQKILSLVEEYAGKFLKEEQIAILIGIQPPVFSEKKKEFPELNEALARGRAKIADTLSNKLYEVAITGNVQMLIFLAKSVLGLRENDPQIQENHVVNVFTSKGSHKFES